ncbi:MAG TPA: N-6 DNA methylase [Silvibacterium sp.]|nr:N-6 DNA methylase [Silvibacterium sp.]
MGTLFGSTREVGQYARGAETSLRITTPERVKRGSADTVYGSAVIEFEKSLKQTLSEAERQLREYVAGIWQREPMSRRNLDAVATDGAFWRIYRPVLPENTALIPENIALELRREIQLKDDTLNDFYRWLNIFLYRPSQLEPTSEAIQEDLGSYSHLFGEGIAALRRAWVTVRNASEARLAFDTWQSYLTVTYGKLSESDRLKRDAETGTEVSEKDELFLRHTWLVSVSRLMIWAALSSGQTTGALRQVAQEVFSGRYFESKRLANLADEDFFHWIRTPKAEQILAPVWERALDTLLTYDLTRIREDVLKGVYQQLIDPKDRHDLGEYYTPDWLCERIVAEMLPPEGYKKILDPSCGSGSFLRAAISHFLRNNPAGTPHERLREILANVTGIDIHPVAVTIARATYVLALGKLVNSARRPIQIPIYLADSLFLPHEVERNLLEQLSGIEITFGPRRNERRFILPDMMVNQPENFDEAIVAATRVAGDLAAGGRESRESLDRYLHEAVPGLSQVLQRDEAVTALWNFTVGLSELIQEKQNSIWSFIIRNSYRPAMLRQQFDIIIGNPPWVAYRYVTDPEYQKEIKLRAVETYEIAPKSQKLFTQMELATVFLAHSLQTFARPGGTLAFVMPRSILTADQHQNLIQRKYSAKFRLTGYWDMWEVKPLFNVPSCVLFAEQSLSQGSATDAIPAQIWTGQLAGRDLPWEKAADRFSIRKAEARVIWLGSRCALSTVAGAKSESRASAYAKAFKQGATIVPRNFYFVVIDGWDRKLDPERLYHVNTNEESARDSKPPYRDVRMSGNVEGRFLFSSTIASHIWPFALREPWPVVLPVEESGGSYHMLATQDLKRNGYRDFAKWMERTERTWNEKRGTKAIRQTALERLDYQRGLTAQSPRHKHLVLYNAAGTNVSATYCDRKALTLPLIVEHTVYWAAFSDPAEAHFVAAILNCASVNEIIKPFQSSGLLGERHIEKKLLDVPIPIFDPEDARHRKLSELGRAAHIEAQAAICDHNFPAGSSLARQRAYVRTALQDTLVEIDGLVRNLLRLGKRAEPKDRMDSPVQ